jgi:hypothetical protein
LLQLGKNPELEAAFHNRMVDDPDFDSFVRGGYLVFYDASLKELAYPNFDDGKREWDKVFNAFKQHIYEDKESKYRQGVRRVEFRLIKQFIETRRSVSPEIAEFYKTLPFESYNFSEAVEKEYHSLIETIRKYELTFI